MNFDETKLVEFCKEHKIKKYKNKHIEIEFDPIAFIDEVDIEEYKKEQKKRIEDKQRRTGFRDV